MDAALQELIRQRAKFRCEYCLLPEALVSTPFQFDHIIAQFHDGPKLRRFEACASFTAGVTCEMIALVFTRAT